MYSQFNEGLSRYIDTACEHGHLPNEEVARLGRLSMKGDIAARDKIVETHLKFVISVAKGYREQGVPMDDLVSEGNMWLVIAADKYEPRDGIGFLSYARWWVRQGLQHIIVEQSKSVHIPPHAGGMLSELRKMKSSLLRDGDRNLHEYLRRIYADKYKLAGASALLSPRLSGDKKSTSRRVNNQMSSASLFDYLPDDRPLPDAVCADNNLADVIRDKIGVLGERDADIMRRRFGLTPYETTQTLDGIGKVYGMSNEAIRQIQNKCLEKLRRVPEIRELAS